MADQEVLEHLLQRQLRRLDLVLESKKLQWQHFPGLPEPAAAFLRVRKETGDQRPVFRGMTADFQVG